MKQFFLLTFIMVLSIFIAQGQITINADDIAPTGVIAQQTIDENPDPAILEGGVGNIDWDFSSLADGVSSTFVFLDPNDTPFSASFPTANLTSEVDASVYAYMIMDDQKIEIIGIEGELIYLGQSIQGKLEFAPGQSLIRFPATYGDSYTETITQFAQVPGSDVGFPSFDSVRLVTTVDRGVEIDAYGMMTTPTGTFETIRSSETETTSNEVFVLSSGNWSFLQSTAPETVINFNWWAIDNNNGFPVVQLQYTPASGNREVTWLKEFFTGTEEAYSIKMEVYPNPAKEYLNIEFPEPFSGNFEIFDMQGKQIWTGSANNSVFEKIEIANLNPGNYILIFKENGGNRSGFKKFEAVK